MTGAKFAVAYSLIGIIGAATVVPHDPSSLLGPPPRGADEIAAVGAEHQVRSAERIECPTQTGARAPVVEDQHLGQDTSGPQPHAAPAAHIGYGLLQTGCREPPLARIAT